MPQFKWLLFVKAIFNNSIPGLPFPSTTWLLSWIWPVGSFRELSYGGPGNVFELIFDPAKQKILLFKENFLFYRRKFCPIEELFAALKQNGFKLIKNRFTFKKTVFVKKNSLIGIYMKYFVVIKRYNSAGGQILVALWLEISRIFSKFLSWG